MRDLCHVHAIEEASEAILYEQEEEGKTGCQHGADGAAVESHRSLEMVPSCREVEQPQVEHRDILIR